MKLKKREDELQLTINELEGKVAELQVRFTKALPELQEYNREHRCGPGQMSWIMMASLHCMDSRCNLSWGCWGSMAHWEKHLIRVD